MGFPSFLLGGIFGMAAFYALATERGRKDAGNLWRVVKEDIEGTPGETADKQPEGDGAHHAPDQDK